MFVSKTPLRVSFFSGGDMKSFYKKDTGAVLSATINKYVYVTVNNHSDEGVRAMHDTTQDVIDLDDLKNVLMKETLKWFGTKNVTVASMADIRGNGTGLGSSSAFTVGLVSVLNAMKGREHSKATIAEVASWIEIDRCNHPIGKQDQFAAAFGGLNLFHFWENENVGVTSSVAAYKALKILGSHLLLAYTGVGHVANDILRHQNQNVETQDVAFKLLQNNARRAEKALGLLEEYKFNDFGDMLHDAWMDKKQIAAEISNDYIDAIYDTARTNGALGGKVLGAGGGGFMLFYVPSVETILKVYNALKLQYDKISFHEFDFVEDGCRVHKI